MLTINESLPDGAVLGGEGRALAAAIAATGGLWFSATPDAVLSDGEAISGWRDTTGSVTADATPGNTGNSRLEPGSPPAMVCEPGQPCGFMISDFAPRVDRFSAAVIYTSPVNEARTLLAVRTGASRNVIYLNEANGSLQATDRDASFSLHLPLAAIGPQPRLAILCFTGRGIILRARSQTVTASGHAPDMDHPGQFLIGCRSSRPGLAKTLGASRLHHVLFWPNRAILGSDDTLDLTTVAAIDRHHRWMC